jgi:hypothetical protein
VAVPVDEVNRVLAGVDARRWIRCEPLLDAHGIDPGVVRDDGRGALAVVQGLEQRDVRLGYRDAVEEIEKGGFVCRVGHLDVVGERIAIADRLPYAVEIRVTMKCAVRLRQRRLERLGVDLIRTGALLKTDEYDVHLEVLRDVAECAWRERRKRGSGSEAGRCNGDR